MTSYPTRIIGGQGDWPRVTHDFYPTPPDVTQALIDFLGRGLPRTVWEPACGDGAMSMVLAASGRQVVSTDLQDRGFGRGGVDFLAADPEDYPASALVTNPPFKLAERFIERAVVNPRYITVAFLLKSQYWHAKSRFSLFDRHPPSWVLPLTWRPAFLEEERGRAPLMDVMWTVWHPRNPPGNTIYLPLERPQRVPDIALPLNLARLKSAVAQTARTLESLYA